MTELLTIADVMERLPKGVSERALLKKLRELGCYRQIGQTIFLTEDDYDDLIEGLAPAPVRNGRVERQASQPVSQEREYQRAMEQLDKTMHSSRTGRDITQ
jgi:hypothetical protein